MKPIFRRRVMGISDVKEWRKEAEEQDRREQCAAQFAARPAPATGRAARARAGDLALGLGERHPAGVFGHPLDWLRPRPRRRPPFHCTYPPPSRLPEAISPMSYRRFWKM